jgi:ADP-ribose pyrophosphatase
VNPWKVLQSRWLLERPWASIRVERVQTGTGVVLDDYPVIETRDWSCIVCVSEQSELVLVRQFRHGVREITLEFPAGGINAGEPPLIAAQRELREETGYVAQTWTHLQTVYPETTRHRHRAHLFLAQGARRTKQQALDPGEEVEVVTVPLAEASELRERLSHGIHVLALLLALERVKS